MEKTTTNTGPWLSVDLGNNGGLLSFNTPKDAQSWHKEEKDFWTWLFSIQQNDSNLNQSTSNFAGLLNSHLHSDIQSAIQNPNNPEIKKRIEEKLIAAYTVNNYAIASKSSEGEFLNTLKNTNPHAAAYAFSYLIRLPAITMGRPDSINGLFEGFCFRHNYQLVNEAEKTRFSKLFSELTIQHSEVARESKELRSEIQTIRSLAEQSLKEQAQANETRMTSQLSEFKEAIDTARSEFQTLKAVYNNHLALAAPAKYWSNRFWWSLAVAAVISGLTAWYISVVLKLDRSSLESLYIGDKLQLSKVGNAILISTLFIWGLRVCVRLFFANVHAALDSRERSVLIRTYLALIEATENVTPADKEFLLKSVFRHTPTGLIKDDALPPHLDISMSKLIK